MKKISENVSNVRQDNSAYFILEKYNNEIRESITKTAAIVEAEAIKVNMTPAEFAEVLSKIYNK
jgi:hypothetical protein